MTKRQKIRLALCKLLENRGCGCCGDHEKCDAAIDELGKLLDLPRYSDDSGVDYGAVLKGES